MSDLEWWLKYGWYRLGVEDFAAVLVLTAVWLLVTVELFVFHRAKTRHDARHRGRHSSTRGLSSDSGRPSRNADRHGGPYPRYPYYWLCVLTSALVWAVVAMARHRD